MGPLVAKRDNDTSRVIKLVTVPDATGKQTIKHVVAAPSEAMPMHQQFLAPNPDRCATTWRRFVVLLEGMGYAGDRRVIKVCDFGAPASRDRLFIIARCDKAIVWLKATHARQPAKGQ